MWLRHREEEIMKGLDGDVVEEMVDMVLEWWR
jgi:hypothetical protein